MFMLLGGGAAYIGGCVLLTEDGVALLTESGVQLHLEQCPGDAVDPCPNYTKPANNAVNVTLDQPIARLDANGVNITICEEIQ
jgi:hypothetical protein